MTARTFVDGSASEGGEEDTRGAGEGMPPCSAVQAVTNRANSTTKCFRAAIGQIYLRWQRVQSAVRS
ncbi:hypothetical protein GCM10022267_55890 [Lentzea roselyniae]|uniref:Uncharacterized protein n=1 Tax=Lentzea roselyniae TaxID=531940 RepID=A0ABP7BL39_9PSEU